MSTAKMKVDTALEATITSPQKTNQLPDRARHTTPQRVELYSPNIINGEAYHCLTRAWNVGNTPEDLNQQIGQSEYIFRRTSISSREKPGLEIPFVWLLDTAMGTPLGEEGPIGRLLSTHHALSKFDSDRTRHARVMRKPEDAEYGKQLTRGHQGKGAQYDYYYHLPELNLTYEKECQALGLMIASSLAELQKELNESDQGKNLSQEAMEARVILRRLMSEPEIRLAFNQISHVQAKWQHLKDTLNGSVFAPLAVGKQVLEKPMTHWEALALKHIGLELPSLPGRKLTQPSMDASISLQAWREAVSAQLKPEAIPETTYDQKLQEEIHKTAEKFQFHGFGDITH